MDETKQPKALRLSDAIKASGQFTNLHTLDEASAELLRQHARIAELEAARVAYASEFEHDADGDPDVGSIHANIRALKSRVAELEREKAALHYRVVEMESELYAIGAGGVAISDDCIWRTTKHGI